MSLSALDFFQHRRLPGLARLSLNHDDLAHQVIRKRTGVPSQSEHQSSWYFRGRHPGIGEESKAGGDGGTGAESGTMAPTSSSCFRAARSAARTQELTLTWRCS